MQPRIPRIPLLNLIAVCAASASITTGAIAAGTAPPPGSSGPIFGQPATATDALPVPGGTAAGPASGSPQWEMDGKTERRERKRSSGDDGTELWTNPGGTREDTTQKNVPAFP